MIRIKTYKAKSGDAFLLSFGEDQDVNIMIDMGYMSTYIDYINNDLIDLKKRGKQLDLMVITHVDSDHIKGAITFLKRNKGTFEIIPVREVWHNSYRHLQFSKEKGNALPKEEGQILRDIINQNRSEFNEDGISDVSAKDGTSFAALLYQYDYNWNSSFNNQAIKSINSKSVSGLKITIISPNIEKLEILAKVWEKYLYSTKYNFVISKDKLFDDAFELFIQNENENKAEISNSSGEKKEKYTEDDIIRLSQQNKESDSSKTNGSSMAFIIQYLNKRLLFLGDAHEDLIYSSLLKLKDNGEELKFDIIKVSHHGSVNNSSKRLFDLVESSKYIISTDGENGDHPSHITLAKIISKKTDYIKEIYINHTIEHLSLFENSVLKEKFKYNIIVTNQMLLM